METILIIEDEKEIRKLLEMTLSASGYKTIEAADGKEGMLMALSHRPSLIILDLGLPDMDGMEVLENLREWWKNPIIILSVRKSENDIVSALEKGANDYLSKPFLPGELIARIRASMRSNRSVDSNPVLEIGDLHIDVIGHIVKKREIELTLTPTEFSLLLLFAENAGRVLTRQYIHEKVWGKQLDDPQLLRVFINQLRKKIEDNPARPTLLMTESGIGYRFA
jgi:two-component system KDP operon response regulator KdpE